MTKRTENSSKKNAVLMGRKTWESIPEKFRPLPGRFNILVSTQATNKPEEYPGCVAVPTFEAALNAAQNHEVELEVTWVIGGSSIYSAAMESGKVHRIYLTKILKNFECDVFLPVIPMENYVEVRDSDVPEEIQEEDGVQYQYLIYERK